MKRLNSTTTFWFSSLYWAVPYWVVGFLLEWSWEVSFSWAFSSILFGMFMSMIDQRKGWFFFRQFLRSRARKHGRNHSFPKAVFRVISDSAVVFPVAVAGVWGYSMIVTPERSASILILQALTFTVIYSALGSFSDEPTIGVAVGRKIRRRFSRE